MRTKAHHLTPDQSEGLAYLIEDHIDNNSYDWQLETNEHNGCIDQWSDILRELGFKQRANKLDKEYKI